MKLSIEKFLNKEGYIDLRSLKEGCPSLLCKRMASFLAVRLVTAVMLKSSSCFEFTGLIIGDRALGRF